MPNTLSPNMSLILPTVGQEPGPNWALDINSSMSLIDQHNHAAGSGVQITPAGIDINTDLPINSNNITGPRSVRFSAQLSPLALGIDIGCIYVSGADLYYNDTLGNQVRLTIAGGVNGTPGSIAGLVAPATATYVPANQTFVWQSNVNTSASLDSGPLLIRNIVANSNAITITPPNPLPADYTVTLPSAPPASTAILEMGNTGIVTTNTTLYPFLNPTGAVILFAGNAAPTGWLLCDGSTLNSVANPQYANLFTAIGITYGGTGANNFKLPDCRGIFVRGAGTQTIGAKTYTGTLGSYENDTTAVNGLSNASNGSHTHNFLRVFYGSTTQDQIQTSTQSNVGYGILNPSGNPYIQAAGAHTHTISSTDAETRPANVAMNYIIKT